MKNKELVGKRIVERDVPVGCFFRTAFMWQKISNERIMAIGDSLQDPGHKEKYGTSPNSLVLVCIKPEWME